jgi:DNA repair exonuclease SbcCD ATPase subunit
MDSGLTRTEDNWREQITALQALLEELRPRLIEAEAHLADRLAAISAFEYKVRARLEPLSHRLDALQAEIDALRKELRRYREGSLLWDEEAPLANSTWRFEESAASAGSYRYRNQADVPRPALEGERLALLKQLYRRLARRFHPDLVLDEADRTYRTDMMMAINAAYAAGDLDALERLANEPDTISYEPRSPEELIAALQREVDHCRRRLAEISTEMTTLERHDSSRLMKRVEKAAAAGRDLLAELAADLRLRISEKMVERDVLEAQLDEVEREGVEISYDDLADIVYNLGLEQADEDNLFGTESDWRPRNPRPWESNDGQDDDEIDDAY